MSEDSTHCAENGLSLCNGSEHTSIFDGPQLHGEELRVVMQVALDRAVLGAILIDSDARICSGNQAACRLLGCGPEDLHSLRFCDINVDCPVEVWPAHWQQIKQLREFIAEARLRRSRRGASASCAPPGSR